MRMERRMFEGLIHSKKGLATPVAAAFFIGIILISLITVIIIDSYRTRYLNVSEDMVEWDIERISENLNITDVSQPSGDSNYAFDILLNNHGGVLVDIARIYVYDEENEEFWGTFDEQEASADEGFNGTDRHVLPGKGGHVIRVNATSNLETSTYNKYRIIVCTERGRQFSTPYPMALSGGGAGLGDFPIIMAAIHDDFQYTTYYSPSWKSGYVKNAKTWQTLYRIRINNTTNQDIIFSNNCSMTQLSGAVEQSDVRRYIVSNSSTSECDGLVAYDGQILRANSSDYIYFGANATNGIEFLRDPSQKVWVISFIMSFQFAGEDEIRTTSFPVFSQDLLVNLDNPKPCTH
jgi:hypothetical protein